MVFVCPFAGPAMDASGAGVGGLPPAGQAWKVPFASAQPCCPVLSRVPKV
ncbi:hypothetical protein M2164_000486 [Streptomyces sp. SAI-208]|nr:hypothetical protein [Streptomyces sp. SAI-208]